MAKLVMVCAICKKKNVACDVIDYTHQGIRLPYYCCEGCYSLLAYNSLMHLRELRDSILEKLEEDKAKEDKS